MSLSHQRSRSNFRHHRRPSAGRCHHYRSLSLQSIPEDGWSDPEDLYDIDRIYLETSTDRSTTGIVDSNSCCAFQTQNIRSTSSLEGATRMEIMELADYERALRDLHPFETSSKLNHLAMQQARAMAGIGFVFHTVATIGELQMYLSSHQVAENVQRGDSASQMHAETMGQIDSSFSSAINRSNLLSPHFREFGCGVAMGEDGKFYCCQLFRS